MSDRDDMHKIRQLMSECDEITPWINLDLTQLVLNKESFKVAILLLELLIKEGN